MNLTCVFPVPFVFNICVCVCVCVCFLLFQGDCAIFPQYMHFFNTYFSGGKIVFDQVFYLQFAWFEQLECHVTVFDYPEVIQCS